MQLSGLNISEIPATRKVRGDTDLRQFVVKDAETLKRVGADWVRRTATDARDMVLAAGNPKQMFVTIDGVTNAAGKVVRSFRSGTINNASSAVLIEFNAEALAGIVRGVLPILTSTVKDTFPTSKTGRLSRDWSWWVSRDGGPSRRVGKMVPQDLGIYDVLYLAPDFAPARYAYMANRAARGSFGHKYNLIMGRTRKSGKVIPTRLRRNLRGYLARATERMRAKRVPGVLFQGGFSRNYMSGKASVHPRGVPFVRVAFKGVLRSKVFV